MILGGVWVTLKWPYRCAWRVYHMHTEGLQADCWCAAELRTYCGVLPDRDWSRYLIAMFKAYFDESGKESDPVGPCVVVSGFVSTVNRWIAFDKVWKDILAEEKIKCFHMHDFLRGEGEFASMKNDGPRKDSFIRRLIIAIRVGAVRSFAAAVKLSDYKVVDKKYDLHLKAHPFTLCGMAVTQKVIHWANGFPLDEIEFVFDQGPEHKGEFLDRMSEKTAPIPSFGDRCKLPGLQAADLVAWEHLKAYRNTKVWGKEQRKLRESLMKLNTIPNDWTAYTIDDIEVVAKSFGLLARP